MGLSSEEFYICWLEDMTAIEICQEYGVTKQWVSYLCKRHGLLLRHSNENHTTIRICTACREPFPVVDYQDKGFTECESCRQSIRKLGRLGPRLTQAILRKQGKRRCPDCGEVKSLDDFYAYMLGKCKTCYNALNRNKYHAKKQP